MHPCLGKEFEGELPRCEEQVVPVQPFKISCGRGSDARSSNFHCVVLTEVLDKNSATLLSELADVGFFTPRSAMSTQPLDQIDTSDFNAMPAEDGDGTAVPDPDNIVQLTTPTQEEEKEIQEWCVSEHVALPLNPLETSDGTVKPLTEKEEKELRDHVNAGHLTSAIYVKGVFCQRGLGEFTAEFGTLIAQRMSCI